MEFKIEPNTELQAILEQVGFRRTGNIWEYDFGNGILSAGKGVKWFDEIFQFFGYYRSERQYGEFEFDLPLKVESYDQGIALISYHLRSAELQIIPEWLKEGLKLEDTLPWKRDIAAWRNNPKAEIEHEWFRVLVSKLKSLALTAGEDDITEFSFDGSLIKVVPGAQPILLAATGTPWKQTAIVKTKDLLNLPKRIYKRGARLYIWENKLHAGGAEIEIVES
jgi:hypothetical protein